MFLRNKTDYSIVFATRQLLFSNFSKFFKLAKKIKKFKKGVDKQKFLLYYKPVLERQHRKVHKNWNAEVAELADAQASGACGSNTVRVQVPPSAFFCFLKRIAGMNKRVRPKGLGSFLYGCFEKPPRNITRGVPSVLRQSHPSCLPFQSTPGNRGAYVRPACQEIEGLTSDREVTTMIWRRVDSWRKMVM